MENGNANPPDEEMPRSSLYVETIKSRLEFLEVANAELHLKVTKHEDEIKRLKMYIKEQEGVDPEADTSLINKLPPECLEQIFQKLDIGAQRKCREVCTRWDNEITRMQLTGVSALTLPGHQRMVSLLSSELSSMLKYSASTFFTNLKISNVYLENNDFLDLINEHGWKMKALSIYQENEDELHAGILPYLIRHCPNVEDFDFECDLTDFSEVENTFPTTTKLIKLKIGHFSDEAEELSDASDSGLLFLAAELFQDLIAASPNLTELILTDPEGRSTGELLPMIEHLPHLITGLSTLQFNGSWIGRIDVDGLGVFMGYDFQHLSELIISDKEADGLNYDTLNLALAKISTTLKILTIEDGTDTTDSRLDMPLLPHVTYFKYMGPNTRFTTPSSLTTKLPNLEQLIYRSPSDLLTSDRALAVPYRKLQELWSAQPLPYPMDFSTINVNFPRLSKVLVTLSRPVQDNMDPPLQPADYFRSSILSLVSLRGLKELYLDFPDVTFDIFNIPGEEFVTALGSLSMLASVERLSIGSNTIRVLPWLGDAFLGMPSLRVVTLVGCWMYHSRDPEFLQPLWDRQIKIRLRQDTYCRNFFTADKYVKSW